ncbi:MAG TPA: hypothetical protein VMV81_13680 [Phycisphaerae bacterium]|nr:hypothetical protein [Phycisphaerae bacterium]
MPLTATNERRKKKPGLRRIIQERAWVRHPVSMTRQRMSIAVLIMLSAGFGLYLYNTRDEAIRQRVLKFLSDATSGDVHVGTAHFRMFGGIELYNVQVSVPFDEKLDPLARDSQSRRIFSASSLTLIHNPWRLLIGTLRVDQIIAARPEIRLVHNVDSGLRNWQLLAGPRDVAAARKGPIPRPNILIRSAKAVSVSVYADGQHEERSEELDADIRPSLTSETSFAIEVRRFSDPAERTTVVFDPMVKMVSNTPYVDARTVRLQLPKIAQRVFDQIALQGEAKIGRFMYDKQNPATMDIEVELRRVRCTVPLSMLRSGEGTVDNQAGPDPEATAVTLVDAVGKLAVRQGKMDVDVNGLFNGARCMVKGTLSGLERPLAQMGIDVKIRGSRVPAPLGSAREQIVNDEAVPQAIKSFFVDYNPRGNFDIDVRLTRPEGPDGRVVLFGSLHPLGAAGNCRFFPYELSELRGDINIEGDQISLEEVTGTHQSAMVRISSRINRRYVWSDARVTIDASHVELNSDLFDALPEDSRRLWNRFNPSGFADLAIQLNRPGTDTGSSPPHWQSRISAALNDSRLRFNEYPYPMDSVQGHVVIEGSHLEFTGLTGRRKKAEIRIDGQADLPEDKPPRVSLKIDAKAVPLDDALAQSLPPEGRGAFEQFQPEGEINLAGDISVGEPPLAGEETGGSKPDGVRFNLRAGIADAAISYQQFPYRITHVNGEVVMRPEGFSILDVTGRHGDAVVTARGDIHRRSDGYVADLAFDCRRLPLTPDLYTALPPSLKETWDCLKPEGVVQIQTALHHESVAGETIQRHRSRLLASGAGICFAGFPLKLSQVEGEVLVSDRKVDIRALSGNGAGGKVKLSGEIDLESGGHQGTLVLDARGIAIRDDLLAALPPGLREQLTSSRAAGTFDLHLDPLQFDEFSDDNTLWRFDGALTMHQMDISLGIDMRKLTGEIKGSGSIFPDGHLAIDAAATLSSANLAGWELQDVTGRLLKETDGPQLEFREMAGRAYGGQATGSADIKMGDRSSEYHVSILARDMQLAEWLRGTQLEPPAPGSEGSRRSPQPRGSIDGNIILQGRTGVHGYREGAGELMVRHAEVWRMPIVFLIFQVLNLTPDENVFHDGWLKFDLSHESLIFRKIDLQGKALSFIGSGTMSLKDKALDLTLLARSPVRIRIPLLTDALELFSREIMEVRVGGTVDKPSISPQPLKTLGILLRAMLSPLTSKPPPIRATSQPCT